MDVINRSLYIYIFRALIFIQQGPHLRYRVPVKYTKLANSLDDICTVRSPILVSLTTVISKRIVCYESPLLSVFGELLGEIKVRARRNLLKT